MHLAKPTSGSVLSGSRSLAAWHGRGEAGVSRRDENGRSTTRLVAPDGSDRV